LTARDRRGRIGVPVALGLAFATLAGCTDAAGYDLDYILSRAPFIATMRGTVAYEAQMMPRPPAPGTVPVAAPGGAPPPPFTREQLDSAAATLVNDVPATPEVLARGATVYNNQCSVCHGPQGEGNGPVVGVGRFPFGPPLSGAATAARSDGYIYAVIRVGRGLMPPYGERISHADRWAVVNYVRQLQGGAAVVAAPPAAPAPGQPVAGAPGAEPPAAAPAGAVPPAPGNR
jgi:mono/diheme cytochrome c family protein